MYHRFFYFSAYNTLFSIGVLVNNRSAVTYVATTNQIIFGPLGKQIIKRAREIIIQLSFAN